MPNPFSKETDGFMARHVDRRISNAISRQLLKTSVTPNQITLGVTFLGLYAGWMMSLPGSAVKIYAAFVFLLTSILDGCDGEVARAKNMISPLGGWLDLWGDNIVHIAVFYGLGLGLYKDTGNPIFITLGQLAAAGTLISAVLASYQMWRKGQSSFTSVSGDVRDVATFSSWRKGLTQAGDLLARRDFVYLVVLLAVIGQLSWFLWAAAIGSLLYAVILGGLCLFTRR